MSPLPERTCLEKTSDTRVIRHNIHGLEHIDTRFIGDIKSDCASFVNDNVAKLSWGLLWLL